MRPVPLRRGDFSRHGREGVTEWDGMKLEKFSIGIGDRFGREGVAQIAALQKAAQAGIAVAPVWNKSNREHTLIGTSPEDTRKAADAAVKESGWEGSYYLDADHIGMETVDRYLPYCEFFTIDVADFIGKEGAGVESTRKTLSPLLGKEFPALGLRESLSEEALGAFCKTYGEAIAEAGRIYQKIASQKEDFIAEVSTDEAETPQSPLEMFLILGGLAGEGVRVQTIAPKFTGRFNKGVDYVGDLDRFTMEFEQDLRALELAVAEFGLPEDLKISVHSGSDKFSLYPVIRALIKRHGAGLHLKTAGTTWLEEVIGLARSGGDGLAMAKEIYTKAHAKLDELCAPYATVIDIDRTALPSAEEFQSWSGDRIAAAITHNPSNPAFNSSLRQVMHVSFKIAAQQGQPYLDALEAARTEISEGVTFNLWERHIHPLFIG